MKQLFSFLSIVLFATLFSCTKNSTYDPNEVSSGSLLVTTNGECKDLIPHGYFEKDSTFTEENYIDVFIQAVTAGQFSISTNTVNGVVFKGSGRIGVEGPNKVRLYGSGKPLENGSFPFRVNYGGRICVANIIFGNGSPNTPAKFILGGAPNNCAGFSINGVYKAGTIIGAGTNSVVCNVFVENIGRYDVRTAVVNGFSFRAQGGFSAPGLQSIILFATGTPTAAGPTNFTISSGTTTCGFPVTVQ